MLLIIQECWRKIRQKHLQMWSSPLNSSSFFCSPDRGVDGETNDEEEQTIEHAEDRGAALIRDREVRGAWSRHIITCHQIPGYSLMEQ